MSQNFEGPTRPFKAAGAIAQHLRVKLTANQDEVDVAGATDIDIGTAEKPAFAAGDVIAVRLRNAQGTRKMVAGNPVAVNAAVYSLASGKIDDAATSTNHMVGVALEAATADGDIIEVMGQYNPTAVGAAD